MRVNELTTAMIGLYVARRRQDNVKDDTINRDLRCAAATLNQTVNLFSHLGDFKPPRVPFIKTDKRRREKVLQPIQVNGILQHLIKPAAEKESYGSFISRFRIGLLVALAAVTGARPGELMALKESDVLYSLNTLKITGSKTRFRTAKTVRYFPLVPVIRQIIAKALEIKVGEFIFSRKGTLTPVYYSAVKQACADAGVKYGRKTVGGIIPYDLRHTATTILVQSGADFETITSLTGQTRHSLWHYTHASNESIDRGANILQNFGAKYLENLGDGLSLDTHRDEGKLSLAVVTNKN